MTTNTMNGNNICFTIAPFPVPFPNRQYANIITALMFIIIMSKYSPFALFCKKGNPFLNLLILKNKYNIKNSIINVVIKFIITFSSLNIAITPMFTITAITSAMYTMAFAIKFAIITVYFLFFIEHFNIIVCNRYIIIIGKMLSE